MPAEKIELELYGGRVKVRHYPVSHKYYVNVKDSSFKQKTGVTTFIGIKDKSTPLQKWYQQITADFLLNLIDRGIPLDYELAIEAAVQNEIQLTKATNIGKEAHEWCELFIRHQLKEKGFEKLPDMPKRKGAVEGVNGFIEWWEQNHIQPIATEKIVYSLKHDYIGTLDFDAKINNVRSLIDFKTSNGLYNGVRLQTIGYKDADEEELGKEIYKQRWAIRLSKFTEAEYIKKEERKNEIRKVIAQMRGWKFREYPIKPYVAFEAMCLDTEKEDMARDRKGFEHAMGLFRWDKETDFFTKAKV